MIVSLYICTLVPSNRRGQKRVSDPRAGVTGVCKASDLKSAGTLHWALAPAKGDHRQLPTVSSLYQLCCPRRFPLVFKIKCISLWAVKMAHRVKVGKDSCYQADNLSSVPRTPWRRGRERCLSPSPKLSSDRHMCAMACVCSTSQKCNNNKIKFILP